jgi:hypothetical protein
MIKKYVVTFHCLALVKCSQPQCRREAAEGSLDSLASLFPLTYHTHGCIDGAYLSSLRFSLVCTYHLRLRLSPCMHIMPSGFVTKTRGDLCFRKGFQAQGNASVSVISTITLVYCCPFEPTGRGPSRYHTHEDTYTSISGRPLQVQGCVSGTS